MRVDYTIILALLTGCLLFGRSHCQYYYRYNYRPKNYLSFQQEPSSRSNTKRYYSRSNYGLSAGWYRNRDDYWKAQKKMYGYQEGMDNTMMSTTPYPTQDSFEVVTPEQVVPSTSQPVSQEVQQPFIPQYPEPQVTQSQPIVQDLSMSQPMTPVSQDMTSTVASQAPVQPVPLQSTQQQTKEGPPTQQVEVSKFPQPQSRLLSSSSSKFVSKAEFKEHNSSRICNPGPPLKPIPKMKNCLVVGDSIALGYLRTVKFLLSNQCQVQHAPFARGSGAIDSRHGLKCFSLLLKTTAMEPTTYDAIIFNFGMHDIDYSKRFPEEHVPFEEYKDNLLKLKQSFLKTGAKVAFALTTPFPSDKKRNDRIKKFNAEAVRIMEGGHRIPVIDLYSIVTKRCGKPPYDSCTIMKGPRDVHYNEEGDQLLGVRVAATFVTLLGQEPRTKHPVPKAAVRRYFIKRDFYSPDNAITCPDALTRCPLGSTCCESLISLTGYGCCMIPNAINCPDNWHCCPSGSTCSPTCNVRECKCITYVTSTNGTTVTKATKSKAKMKYLAETNLLTSGTGKQFGKNFKPIVDPLLKVLKKLAKAKKASTHRLKTNAKMWRKKLFESKSKLQFKNMKSGTAKGGKNYGKTTVHRVKLKKNAFNEELGHLIEHHHKSSYKELKTSFQKEVESKRKTADSVQHETKRPHLKELQLRVKGTRKNLSKHNYQKGKLHSENQHNQNMLHKKPKYHNNSHQKLLTRRNHSLHIYHLHRGSDVNLNDTKDSRFKLDYTHKHYKYHGLVNQDHHGLANKDHHSAVNQAHGIANQDHHSAANKNRHSAIKEGFHGVAKKDHHGIVNQDHISATNQDHPSVANQDHHGAVNKDHHSEANKDHRNSANQDQPFQYEFVSDREKLMRKSKVNSNNYLHITKLKANKKKHEIYFSSKTKSLNVKTNAKPFIKHHGFEEDHVTSGENSGYSGSGMHAIVDYDFDEVSSSSGLRDDTSSPINPYHYEELKKTEPKPLKPISTLNINNAVNDGEDDIIDPKYSLTESSINATHNSSRERKSQNKTSESGTPLLNLLISDFQRGSAMRDSFDDSDPGGHVIRDFPQDNDNSDTSGDFLSQNSGESVEDSDDRGFDLMSNALMENDGAKNTIIKEEQGIEKVQNSDESGDYEQNTNLFKSSINKLGSKENKEQSSLVDRKDSDDDDDDDDDIIGGKNNREKINAEHSIDKSLLKTEGDLNDKNNLVTLDSLLEENPDNSDETESKLTKISAPENPNDSIKETTLNKFKNNLVEKSMKSSGSGQDDDVLQGIPLKEPNSFSVENSISTSASGQADNELQGTPIKKPNSYLVEISVEGSASKHPLRRKPLLVSKMVKNSNKIPTNGSFVSASNETTLVDDRYKITNISTRKTPRGKLSGQVSTLNFSNHLQDKYTKISHSTHSKFRKISHKNLDHKQVKEEIKKRTEKSEKIMRKTFVGKRPIDITHNSSYFNERSYRQNNQEYYDKKYENRVSSLEDLSKKNRILEGAKPSSLLNEKGSSGKKKKLFQTNFMEEKDGKNSGKYGITDDITGKTLDTDHLSLSQGESGLGALMEYLAVP